MSLTKAQEYVDMTAQRKEAVQVGPHLPITLARVQSIASDVFLQMPSSFHSQSTRIVMLVGSDHQNLWKAVANNNMYAEEREAIERNLEGAAGTFLFFEDFAVVEGLQQQLPSYAAAFPLFAMQTSGLVISAVWEALSLENVAGCVHHYSPDVCAQSAKVPAKWKCTGQLVFGSAQKAAMKMSRKTDDSHRFKVAKGDQ